LYAKEVASGLSTAALLAAGIAALDVFVSVRIGGAAEMDPYIFFALMPIALIPLWAPAASYQSLSGEWSGNTISLLKGLPVGGYSVMGAKLLATMTYFTALSMVAGVGAIFVIWRTLLPQDHTFIFVFAAYAYGPYWLVAAVLAVVGQLTFLVGRTVERWRGGVRVAALLLQAWFLQRFGGLLRPAFQWVPDLTLPNSPASYPGPVIDSSTGIALILGTALLFALGGWLLDRVAEV